MKDNTVNGYGYFRKSKAYGLVCGIVLGSAFLGGQVHADETTQTTDSTSTEQVTSQTIIEPATESLSTAIASAESAGVTVTETTTETVANQEEAQADYDTQAENLAEVTAQQEAINAENATTTEANTALTSAYESTKETAEATNQAVSEASSTYTTATVTETTVDYGDGTSVSGYQTGESTVKSIAEANSEAITTYLSEKESVDAYNATVKAREDALKLNNLASDEANYLYVTGEFDTSATGLDYYKNITVVTLDPDAKAVSSLGWQSNTSISDATGLTVQERSSSSDSDFSKVASSFVYKVSDVNVGDTFKLNNIGTTTDGTNINAVVTVTKTTTLDANSDSWFFIGNTVDNGIAFLYWNYDQLGLSFNFIDDSGNDLKLVVGSIVGDVDWVQSSKIDFDGNSLNYINPEGSELTVNDDNSLTAGNFAIFGYQNAPKGTYLAVGSSTVLNYVHTSGPYAVKANGKFADYIEFDLFGTSSQVVTEEFKYLPDPTLSLTSVTLPDQPTLTSLKDNLTATYHLNSYDVALSTVKDVLNAQGVSINNGTLALGETGYYTLEGSKILANGKDTLVKYDFEDYLDTAHDRYQGYRIYAFVPITLTDGTVINSMEDLEAYAQAVYDDATGRFYVSLNSDFLARVSKDSDFQAKVSIAFTRIVTGDVHNVFNNIVAFQDTEGNITEVPIPSNKVVTHTPDTPKPDTPKETPTTLTTTPTTPTTTSTVQVVHSETPTLPQTGDYNSLFGLLPTLSGGLLTGIALGDFSKRKSKK